MRIFSFVHSLSSLHAPHIIRILRTLDPHNPSCRSLPHAASSPDLAADAACVPHRSKLLLVCHFNGHCQDSSTAMATHPADYCGGLHTFFSMSRVHVSAKDSRSKQQFYYWTVATQNNTARARWLTDPRLPSVSRAAVPQQVAVVVCKVAVVVTSMGAHLRISTTSQRCSCATTTVPRPGKSTLWS